MRLIRKRRVRIPPKVRRVLSVKTNVAARIEPAEAAREIQRMRGAGEAGMEADEILALTRK